ncbi:hypothetical protein MES4922_550009 [Mesorhizobium ventifaucium]|uniref:Uncharacterized protein n=1 Tax=Mesorhizobium ventifaucium TaxID=666020 RepID=A0ABN8K926_9HYPH|nr:hypothetical protein MES4922_550009 [Mesorhizobium ventifaucium]
MVFTAFDADSENSYPRGIQDFSTKDDRNEESIVSGYGGCDGPEVSLVVLILADGQWRARVRPLTAY